MAKRTTGIIAIENEIIFARVYKFYNKTLVKRLGDHMCSYNNGEKSKLYQHMRKIGRTNFKMKLLEQKWIEEQ
jgi:hypothetical protein